MSSPGGAPGEHLEAGAVVAGRYEIVRCLGTGGMGTVYLARHREMERPCAIKLLHPTLAGDREALDRFAREARNASRIAHPHVCTIYDYGTTDNGLVYLVMEYVEGRTLGALLLERGALPLGQAAALVEAIAAGLDAAHELGIIHRDLKPDNVMVGLVGGRETVKLVDFGIAKALAGELDRELTAPGIVVGTPDYMAPEQFAGDPPDRRTDTYALGVMFYRMVTGAFPYTGTTARQTLTRRLTEPPRSLAEGAPQRTFPAGLQEVVNQSMARRPEDRYPTAGGLARALRHAIGGEAAPTDSLPTMRLDAATTAVAMAARRRAVWPWAMAAVVVAAVGGVYAWQQRAVAKETGNARADTTSADSLAPSATSTVPVAPVATPAADSTSVAPTPRDTARRERPTSAPGTPTPTTAASAPAPLLLPTPEEIFGAETQESARVRAEAIYERTDADVVRRAQAAFIVATILQERGRGAEAESWAVRAALLNDSAPAGPDRDRRAERYRAFITQLRRPREEAP